MSSFVSDKLRSGGISLPTPPVRQKTPVAPLVEDRDTDLSAGSGFACAAMIGLVCWVIIGAVVWTWLR